MQPSFSNVMEEAMKFPTCHLHIWRDGKSKFKGQIFGFIEKGTNCAQAFISHLLEIGQPML